MGSYSLNRRARSAVAYVEVNDTDGPSIGTAFHVGEGMFVTAAHVVKDKEIIKIGTTVPCRTPVNIDPSGNMHEYTIVGPVIGRPRNTYFSKDRDMALLVMPEARE
jgi:V8-like Glu-specific endopeptidase